MSSAVLPLGSKPVRDADDRPIGHVAGSETSAVTGDPRWLLVELAPETVGSLDDRARFRWLPYDDVDRIRRDGIHLADRLPKLL